MEATYPAMNANNSEVENPITNDSDFEIVITPTCPGTVDVTVVDIGTKITYSGKTYYTKKGQNYSTDGRNSEDNSTNITIYDTTKHTPELHDVPQETANQLPEEPATEQAKHMLELTECDLQSIAMHDLNNKHITPRNTMLEHEDTPKERIETIDDLGNIDIQISLGICPGTIDIDVVDKTEHSFTKGTPIWRNGAWSKQDKKHTRPTVHESTHEILKLNKVSQLQKLAKDTLNLQEHTHCGYVSPKCTEPAEGRKTSILRDKKHRFRSNSGDYIISCNGAIDVDIKPTILDEIDSQIPRIAPRKLKHVQFDVPKWNKYYSDRVIRREKTNLKWMECISNNGMGKLDINTVHTQPAENKLTPTDSQTINSHENDTNQTEKVPPKYKMSSASSSTPDALLENRLVNGQVYYKRDMPKTQDVSDTYTRSRPNYNKQRSPQNKPLTDNHSTRRCIISFTEDELVYSAEQEAPVPKHSQSSHDRVIVLKKGERLDSTDTIPETDDRSDDNRVSDLVRDGQYIKAAPINLTAKHQSQTFYKQKHNTNRKHEHDYHARTTMNCKDNHEQDERKIKEYNDTKHRDNKNKKRRNKNKAISGYVDGKNVMKRVPRTRLEKFQRDIDAGIVRPIFTKHRSGGLKRMKLQRELHHGSFATTFKGEYINQEVAVTVYSEDVNNIDLLQLIQLNRSNFVLGLKDNLRGSGTDLWLIHKFLPLGDLQHVLAQDPHRHVLGERHARFITAGLLLGLDYLHQNNVIHGNLKPSKILFNNLGFPVLTGFRAIAHADSSEQASVDVYTLAYSSPDRLHGDRDPSIDIFSLGSIAYEVVTGRTPFDGYGETETRENILNNWYSPMYDPDQFSFAGELFIHSCLRKHKSQRFTTGRNLNNMKREEWFSSIDIKMLKRQLMVSPLLDAFRYIQKGVQLDSEQKYADYNWGSVMDVLCPHAPTMHC